jgi:hypothetical protein
MKTKAEMRAELAALAIERGGKFYRPDGSEIPFKRIEPRKRSSAITCLPHNREQHTFDLLDADSGVGADGRSRMRIFSSDREAADGTFHVMPCTMSAEYPGPRCERTMQSTAS